MSTSPVMNGDAETGVTLSWRDGPTLRGVRGAVEYHVGETSHSLHLHQPDQTARADGLTATWRWQPSDDGYRVWIELANEGDVPLILETADLLLASSLDLGCPPAEWSVYQNGWQSWTPTFARHTRDSLYTDPGTPDYQATHLPHAGAGEDGLITSEWVMVIADARRPLGGSNLLLGFVTTAEQLGELRLRADGSQVVARCHFDGALLAPGASVRSEQLWLRAGPDPLVLLEEWAAAAGREMSARIPASPPTGWCTWYYFYGENSATDVVNNLQALVEYDLPLEVILLDDGYQTAIGDWFSLKAHRFPDGMTPLAEAIRAAGRRFGLWTAPFGAARNSQLYAAHPDWFLRDEQGQPVVGWMHWGVDCYALDCTHPEVLAWLEETFRRLRREWGVDFFKIDFIFAAARPGRRYDPSATRAQALRRGVTAVRAGIGDDAFLLGCGAPLGPCIGLVDGMRIGPDVSLTWHPLWRQDLAMPAAESAMRNSITRAPFHNRLWANDPDCLLVRQRGANLNLVLNEMRTLSALTALLGGLTINSDHLPAIRLGRLKYLRQALPPTGLSARPLDMFAHEMPRLLLLSVEREWGRWWVAGLVNWEEHTVETRVRLEDLGLPPGRYHAYNYWRRRYLGTIEEGITIPRHQPHETIVLLFKPVTSQPELLTTTFHVCQGVAEVLRCEAQDQESGLVLRTILQKAGRQFGEVLFTVPPGWQATTGRVDGVRQTPRSVAPGVVALGMTLAGQAEVEVAFQRLER
jgi:alpha-galactosidase